MPGGIGRAVDELVHELPTVQKTRIANQMDATLWKEHPGIDLSTATMMNSRATRYLSQETTGPKPKSAIAYFTKDSFEKSFGKVDPKSPEEADELRRYYWQLKTGDGIEDLVTINAPAGVVKEVQGKAAAAAMWRMNPKAKVPVLVENASRDWDTSPARSLMFRGEVIPLDLPRYKPAEVPKPAFNVDPGSRMGRMTFDPNSPMSGDIATMERGSDVRQITLSFVPEKYRGTGRGITMYQMLADQTLKEGKRLVSDTQVSPDAAKMYDALEKRGYQIKRNEFEMDKEAGVLRSTNGQPIFEVIGKGESKKPLTTVRQAE